MPIICVSAKQGKYGKIKENYFKLLAYNIMQFQDKSFRKEMNIYKSTPQCFKHCLHIADNGLGP